MRGSWEVLPTVRGGGVRGGLSIKPRAGGQLLFSLAMLQMLCLRLLLLLLLLGSLGALLAPRRRRGVAPLPAPYLTRYLTQQVGARRAAGREESRVAAEPTEGNPDWTGCA